MAHLHGVQSQNNNDDNNDKTENGIKLEIIIV